MVWECEVNTQGKFSVVGISQSIIYRHEPQHLPLPLPPPCIPQQPVLVDEDLGKHVLEDVLQFSLLCHENVRLCHDVHEYFH